MIVLMIAAWVVGGVLSFFGALAFSELAAAYPQAGGMYVYLREAYGRLVAQPRVHLMTLANHTSCV